MKMKTILILKLDYYSKYLSIKLRQKLSLVFAAVTFAFTFDLEKLKSLRSF